MTANLEARSLEYAILAGKSQVANDLLVKLTNNRESNLSSVDPRFLTSFFEQSLKQDNIDGIAHLVNFAERFGVDLGQYPINKFRGALDYYLNREFDLSKVMTFLKFYQRHFADRAR